VRRARELATLTSRADAATTSRTSPGAVARRVEASRAGESARDFLASDFVTHVDEKTRVDASRGVVDDRGDDRDDGGRCGRRRARSSGETIEHWGVS